MSRSLALDEKLISQAVQALKRGELVAFPTETVYGLGADASNAEALIKLYKAKGRPTNHPVIVHIATVDHIARWARQVPRAAYALADAFWPGPLTMVLPRAPQVLDLVTGGQNTVAIRIPNHPVALALLSRFGGGIAAPSANRFGRLSPTSAEDVRAELGDRVAVILDGGPCQVGIESTIVDLTRDRPRILRPGMILPELVAQYAGVKSCPVAGPSARRPRAPGGLPSHYAPDTPMRLVAAAALKREISALKAHGQRVAVMSFQERAGSPGAEIWITAHPDSRRYAHDLYSNLRALDCSRCDLILVEEPPPGEDWIGVRDRLSRAAAREDLAGDST